MKKLYMVSWPACTKKSWTDSNLHSKPRKIFKGLKIWFKNIVLSFPLTHFEINHFFWSFLTDWHHHIKYCDQNFRVYILKKWINNYKHMNNTCRMYSNQSNKSWKFGIHIFGIGCLIRCARFNLIYACNNIPTTLIQISRLFYFGFFSKTNHQMMF